MLSQVPMLGVDVAHIMVALPTATNYQVDWLVKMKHYPPHVPVKLQVLVAPQIFYKLNKKFHTDTIMVQGQTV